MQIQQALSNYSLLQHNLQGRCFTYPHDYLGVAGQQGNQERYEFVLKNTSNKNIYVHKITLQLLSANDQIFVRVYRGLNSNITLPASSKSPVSMNDSVSQCTIDILPAVALKGDLLLSTGVVRDSIRLHEIHETIIVQPGECLIFSSRGLLNNSSACIAVSLIEFPDDV